MMMSFIISSVVHTHLSVCIKFMFAHAQREIYKMLYHHGRHIRPRARAIQGQLRTHGSIENTTKGTTVAVS